MYSKELLRNKIRPINRIDRSSISSQNIDVIIALCEKYEHIGVYLPTKYEPDTAEIIKKLSQAGKSISIPKLINNTMCFQKYNLWEELQKNTYWVNELNHNKWINQKLDFCITPGLAFWIKGERLWHWKWYYDKYFWENKNIFKLWLCKESNILDNIPMNKHDVYMNAVVTEDNIYYT